MKEEMKESVEDLIQGLEDWKREASETAQRLREVSQEAEPVVIVGDRRYTIEGWAADLVTIAAEDSQDGVDRVIDLLRRCLDAEGALELLLEEAEDGLRDERLKANGRACLARLLRGNGDGARWEGELRSLVIHFGRVNVNTAAARQKMDAWPAWAPEVAERLGVDPEELVRALPSLDRPREEELRSVAS